MKGQKTGGRTKGVPNRTPEAIRKAVQAFIEQNFDSLQREYELLDGKDKLAFFERLLRHVLPRPLNELERLPDDQLDELFNRLKNSHESN